MTTFKLTNWKKPTPQKWRNIGDALLLAIPVITASLEMLPIPGSVKPFLMVACNLLLVTGKFLTKLTHEDNNH
jgi:hypothetical protein